MRSSQKATIAFVAILLLFLLSFVSAELNKRGKHYFFLVYFITFITFIYKSFLKEKQNFRLLDKIPFDVIIFINLFSNFKYYDRSTSTWRRRRCGTTGGRKGT